MKRTVCLLCVLILMIGSLAMVVSAASTGSLTGPDAVRAGDTITLNFQINGVNLYAVNGTLNFDPNQLTLVEAKQTISDAWGLEFSAEKYENFNGCEFMADDSKMKNPINKNTSIFTLKFKVKADLAVGTKITVTLTNVNTSDGEKDMPIGTVSYSATIAPPLSTENKLQSLTVSNATISPAFSPDVTEYTADVPFEVAKLDVKAAAKDGKAKVTVDSPNLRPNGTTKVTVTVTAENGSKKVYTITVKRAQDPNYVPSGENTLSGIQVDGFLLSPAFAPEVTEYLVWLPYEVDSLSLNGTALSGLASVEVVGGEVLEAGQDNVIQIICTAENGEQKIYTVIAKRAPAHTQEPTEPSDPTQPTDPSQPTGPADPTEPSAPAPTDPKPTDPKPTEPGAPVEPQPEGGIQLWVLILATVAALGLGLGAGLLIGKKK